MPSYRVMFAGSADVEAATASAAIELVATNGITLVAREILPGYQPSNIEVSEIVSLTPEP